MTVLVCAEGQQRTTSAVYVMGQALLLGSATVLVMWKTVLVFVVAMYPLMSVAYAVAVASLKGRAIAWDGGSIAGVFAFTCLLSRL